MRNALRSLTIALLAMGAVSCAEITGGARQGGLTRATFSLAPRFEPNAGLTAAALSQLGLAFDSVRVLIVRLPADTLAPPTETLKDTAVAYRAGDSPLTLELSVLAVPGEQLRATLQYKSGATVLFEGSAKVTAKAATAVASADNTVSITVKYTGPGATATKLILSPGAGTYASGIVTTFTAKAFDASNTELLNVPITWSVSDTNVATIHPLSGALTPKLGRGTVTVKAALGALSASASVKFAPLATRLRVVQGAAQSGPPGSQLPLPVIVEAVAADGLPGMGAGTTATFVANTGGSVNPASAPFNAEGRAQALFTLGSNAGGIYLYTVTAGALSIIVPEIAVVGPPTQLIPSGSTTLTMTAGVVPNPLPTFRVADALGNSVPGVPLQVTITKQGTTETKTFSFLADTIGLVNVSALMPTIAATLTVTFASANAAVSFPSLTYTVTILPGPAAKLQFDRVPLTAVSNSPISSGVSVVIQDSYGNMVTSSTSAVTISLDAATGAGESLSGTVTVNAVNGVAGFTNLVITGAKNGVKLVASSPGLSSALSTAINITP